MSLILHMVNSWVRCNSPSDQISQALEPILTENNENKVIVIIMGLFRRANLMQLIPIELTEIIVCFTVDGQAREIASLAKSLLNQMIPLCITCYVSYNTTMQREERHCNNKKDEICLEWIIQDRKKLDNKIAKYVDGIYVKEFQKISDNFDKEEQRMIKIKNTHYENLSPRLKITLLGFMTKNAVGKIRDMPKKQ